MIFVELRNVNGILGRVLIRIGCVGGGRVGAMVFSPFFVEEELDLLVQTGGMVSFFTEVGEEVGELRIGVLF